MKKEPEDFWETGPTREQIRSSAEGDKIGSAIAQVVIANEMPHLSVREAIHIQEHRSIFA
jgi:hypothetical protein